MNIITAPTVTLISRQEFIEPTHLKCDWVGEVGSTAAKITEYSGRLCYLSYKNPGRRSSRDYSKNILVQGHGSVTEHAVFGVLIEGISRSCSHELVRHRAGWAYSQQSQRYVDEADCAFVEPPLIQDADPLVRAEWRQSMATAQVAYTMMVQRLMLQLAEIEDRVLCRKMAREAARSVLPNATETKIVATANVRAWRTMLELRCGMGAEREIRKMAIACLLLLRREAPELFGDFTVVSDGFGHYTANVEHHKV